MSHKKQLQIKGTLKKVPKSIRILSVTHNGVKLKWRHKRDQNVLELATALNGTLDIVFDRVKKATAAAYYPFKPTACPSAK